MQKSILEALLLILEIMYKTNGSSKLRKDIEVMQKEFKAYLNEQS